MSIVLIVQFICFSTALQFNPFVTAWDAFAQQSLRSGAQVITLNRGQADVPCQYVSRNEWPTERFVVAFPNGQMPADTRQGGIAVAQWGGYYLEQLETLNPTQPNLRKVLLFLPKTTDELSFIKPPTALYLNVYKALGPDGGNSRYGYILELYTTEAQAAGLLRSLKTRYPEAQGGIYREALKLPAKR